MAKHYKIIIVIVAVIIGYLIGNFLPIQIFRPTFTNETINKSEYYKLIISIISACITFTAVVVALFKDDFREYWKRPKVQFNSPSKITIEDLSASIESEINNDNIIANKYVSRVEVINVGNLPVLNAEIYLDKLEYTPKDTSIAQVIESSSSALEWNGTESLNIIIPPGGKKLINIAEITPPEKFSTPDSERTNKPPCLTIGNIKNVKERSKGKWTATFSLYAQNHRPVSFKVEIEWTGNWKNRLAEFNNQYKITIKA